MGFWSQKYKYETVISCNFIYHKIHKVVQSTTVEIWDYLISVDNDSSLL